MTLFETVFGNIGAKLLKAPDIDGEITTFYDHYNENYIKMDRQNACPFCVLG